MKKSLEVQITIDDESRKRLVTHLMKMKIGWIKSSLACPVAMATFLVAGIQAPVVYGAPIPGSDVESLGLAETLAAPLAIPQALLDLQDSDAQDLPPLRPRAGPDHDGDGIDSDVDPDDDDDRISDVDEGLIDADNDGVPDANSRDTDEDGVPDGIDSDSDNDGIPDWDEAVPNSSSGIFTPTDTDSDNVPDYLDLESDGDGIFDLVEAGGADTDNDGIVDNFTDTTGKGIDDGIHASALPVFDTDIDGTHDYRDTDSDNDTIPDSVEVGNSTAAPNDADGDGAADYREEDSDGDGIPDSVEAGLNPLQPDDFDNDGAPNHADTDSDNDGLLDSVEAGPQPEMPVDTDNDNSPDYLDLDSDNDGTNDGNGQPANGPDIDGDGIPNQIDLDDDNDGILDTDEGAVDADNDGVLDPSSTDTDGDSTPDAWDLDSDNDGILDLWEATTSLSLMASLDLVVNGAVDIAFPVGANGVADALETAVDSGVLTIAPVRDTDGDNVPDFRDLDSDADNIYDLIEAGGVDTDGNGSIDGFVDTDGKGVDDAVQASALPIFDTDGSGQPDWRDTDSDADGIPDSVEGGGIPNLPTDTDGDGAGDYRETDSDGDGLLDSVEAGGNPAAPVDTDNDGDPDYQDLDSDNDGTQDGGTTPPATGPDTDGDGIPNQTDLDDDNDGILDTDEGAVDANNDGILDGGSTDTDGDGVPDAWDLDTDNDGILDLWEASTNLGLMQSLDLVVNGAVDIAFPVGANGIPDALETAPDSGVLTILPVTDTDNDGVHDFRDTDSDDDGINDLVEAGGVDSNGDGRIDNFVDTDDKGVDDTVQANALPIFDTDGNGTPDWRDLDSDSDSIPDSVEAGDTPNTPTDTDGDGAGDYRETDSDGDSLSDTVEAGGDPADPADTDGDGDPDYQDTDSDNDGTPDGGGTTTPTTGPDIDGDGIANQQDLDDDNDGIPDTQEGAVDSNGDGVLDAASLDTDGDGTPDAWDLDSDNDGILDNEESRRDLTLVQSLDQVVNGAIDIGVEVGNNGLADILETSADSGVLNYTVVDTDVDGTPDFQDIDSDNDGIKDLIEAGGTDSDDDGRIDNFVDTDDKGVDDNIQNNALPVFDTDNDGDPDFRDTDSDGDTIPDDSESGPVANAPVDTDGDGAPDYREQDSDNDTLPDNVEAGGDPANPVDTDNDGTPDFQDLDSDNDTIPDAQEQPDAPSGPVSDDVDGDGVPNDVDVDDDNDGIMDADEGLGDADSDGVSNQYDLEADNDGLFDLQEASLNLQTSIDLDTDGDGMIDLSNIGPNGYAEILQEAINNGGTPIGVADADGDNVPDFLDVDSDNDGIFDSIESGHQDANMDGRIDFSGSVNASGVATGVGGAFVDTDGDGVVDFRDLDSDNDGLVDLVEATGNDADGNGRVDGFTDANNDGADDSKTQNPVIPPDTDGDLLRDFRDLDSDNDGLSDLLETAGPSEDINNDGLVDGFTDSNGDGLHDPLAGNPYLTVDTDNDAFPDHLDLDSDSDGLFDIVETNGVDTDQDGVVDTMADLDRDGIPDSVDADQTGGTDSDLDGVDDRFDISFVNDGVDTDGDQIIDSADPDADGDGFAGIVDDGAVSNQNLPDVNGNGVLDYQEVDGAVNPNTAASSSIVETGLSGTGFGCAIAPTTNAATIKTAGIDPLLPTLLLIASAWLLRRRTAVKAVMGGITRRKSLKAATVVTAAAMISSCGSIDFGRFNPFSRDDAEPRYVEENGNDFNRRFYVGAGAGMTRLEPNATKVQGVDVEDTASAGGQLTIGMDLTNRFSVEAHAGDLGSAAMSPAGSIGYQIGGLSGIAYLINDDYDRGRREGLNLFARLGLGAMKNQAEVVQFERVNDFHLLAGIGVEYGLRMGLAARAELISFDKDAQLAQLGLVYRFGKHDDPAPVAPVPSVPVALPAPIPVPLPVEPADSDMDGVPNAFDECPTTGAGTPVNDAGCAMFAGVIEGVNFETNSAQLLPEAVEILNGVADTLLQYPDIRVTIEAHTDNQGSATSNLELSKKRAISVARFLVDRGVAGSRLQPQAFGESKPRAGNATSEGRRVNRRVEFNTL